VVVELGDHPVRVSEPAAFQRDDPHLYGALVRRVGFVGARAVTPDDAPRGFTRVVAAERQLARYSRRAARGLVAAYDDGAKGLDEVEMGALSEPTCRWVGSSPPASMRNSPPCWSAGDYLPADSLYILPTASCHHVMSSPTTFSSTTYRVMSPRHVFSHNIQFYLPSMLRTTYLSYIYFLPTTLRTDACAASETGSPAVALT
jgi:hypothetical protein